MDEMTPRRYEPRPELWAALDADERTAEWLARKAAVSGSFVRFLRTRERQTVTGEVAARIAAAMGQPLDALFLPRETTSVVISATEAAG